MRECVAEGGVLHMGVGVEKKKNSTITTTTRLRTRGRPGKKKNNILGVPRLDTFIVPERHPPLV